MQYILTMSKNTQAINSLPPKVVEVLGEMGHNIKIARKRRKLSAKKAAELALVSRNTLARAEKGEPSVSIGVYASILYILQLDGDLCKVANPDTDDLGKALAYPSRELEARSGHAKEAFEEEDDYQF